MTRELEFCSLSEIELYGVPIEIDGVKLTFTQAKVLVGIVETTMDQAKHKFQPAVSLAIEVFKNVYELDGDAWKAKRQIKLKDHSGQVFDNRHFKTDEKERIMGRIKAKRKAKEAIKQPVKESKTTVAVLMEAGRRNSGKDKEKVSAALSSIFDVLSKDDQQNILKTLSAKLGKTIRFKKEE